jgi:hypothetical protein
MNPKRIQAKHSTQNTTIKGTTTGNTETIQTTATDTTAKGKVKHAI